MSVQAGVEEIVHLGCEVVDALRDRKMTARLFGGTAIELLTGASARPKDIDIVVPHNMVPAATKCLSSLGWRLERRSLLLGDRQHALMTDRSGRCQLDIFGDPLRFNHTIRLANRFDLLPYSISVSDLLLTKLQIVCPVKKDMLDIARLCAFIAGGGVEDAEKRIVDVTCSEWGFYHTALKNLATTKTSCVLDDSAGRFMTRLSHAMADAPKSLRWRLRSVFGELYKWYAIVD